MEKTKAFKEQVVMISGGLGDIGQAIAKAFASEGAYVAIGDILPVSEANKVRINLGIAEGYYHYQQVDVRDGQVVADWVEAVTQYWKLPSIAIVNAATVTLKNFQQLTDVEWNNELQVNLSGAYFFANALAKRLEAKGQPGNIVFLGSWAAHAVHSHIPAYSVSKAGIRMLCRSMALAYAAVGIRVNELAPGYVNAGLSKAVWEQDPDLAAQAKTKVPLHSLIETDELASQVLWLCHAQNKHITGSTFLIDGGLSLVSISEK
ncbi:SDR family NAD(P)-dependent oxidoreductase [Olivibacter jilunii]|uniref:SDR family NAD(P)-dependent oxidoreductase n=1 Tax=Olivibacter jilunii TaxID=985016 RepID=UPI001030DB34|nr:SDR family oxidoreductase [Olivibacter jilunii]